MSNKPVTDALKRLLADTYSLQLKTQNYHWNVEGTHFRSLHLLFEEQYNDLFAAVDVIAERIRALGEKAPGTYSEFAKLSKIKEAQADAEDMAMASDLYTSNQQLSQSLKKLIEIAEKADDAATADLATQRLATHDKAAWMLKSSLPKGTKLKAVA